MRRRTLNVDGYMGYVHIPPLVVRHEEQELESLCGGLRTANSIPIYIALKKHFTVLLVIIQLLRRSRLL